MSESFVAPGPISRAQREVLTRAAKRPGGFLCPTPGLWAASQTAVIRSLQLRGLATEDGSPVITDYGVAVVEAFEYVA